MNDYNWDLWVQNELTQLFFGWLKLRKIKCFNEYSNNTDAKQISKQHFFTQGAEWELSVIIDFIKFLKKKGV